MSQELDAKKHVIIGILGRLRDYNPAIGTYERSVMNSNFQYAVKLSNGRIVLSEEIVYDYEKDPFSVSGDRFETFAGRFTADELQQQPVAAPIPPSPSPSPTERYSKERRGSGSRGIIITLVLLALLVLAYYGYNSMQESNEKQNARVNIYELVSVSGSNYRVNELFGGVSDLRITVTNNSDYIADIVKVKISYIKKDGGLYKDEMLYFNKVAPHSTQTQNAPTSDRGTSVKVSTESISCAELGI